MESSVPKNADLGLVVHLGAYEMNSVHKACPGMIFLKHNEDSHFHVSGCERRRPPKPFKIVMNAKNEIRYVGRSSLTWPSSKVFGKYRFFRKATNRT